MNKPTDLTKTLTLEWHQLELRYQSLRIHTAAATRRLMLSIHEHGLLTPITVIPSGIDGQPWVVIDGHLRISAVKSLRHDAIAATPWDVAVPDALLQAYQYNASRPWVALEEANLIQELITLHGYTQKQLANRLGKSAAWVCHRLQLLHDLPDFLKVAIQQGTLSTWTASRIFVPFARANSDDAEQLVQYLQSHPQNSRDIQAFYEHYLRANKNVRQQISANPSLFFKTHELLQLEEKAQHDKLSPEYLWQSKLSQMNDCINVLRSIFPSVFYPEQNQTQKTDLLKPFNQFLSNVNSLQHQIRRTTDAPSSNQTSHSTVMVSGKEDTRDQPHS